MLLPRAIGPLALLGMLLSVPALSHNYTFLDGAVMSRDDGREDDAGLRIAGTGDLVPHLAAIGQVVSTGEFDQLSAGAMFHTPISTAMDVTLGGTLEFVDDGRRDDTGLGARAGVRWQAIPARFELNPEILHVNVFDDIQSSLRVAGLYYLDRRLDLHGALQGGDEDRFEMGLRYNFGPRLERPPHRAAAAPGRSDRRGR